MKFVSCMGDSWPLIYNCWCLALILVIMSCFNPLDFLTFFCVSSNGSQDTFEENQEKKAIIPVGRKRLTRSRFSYSFSPHGIILVAIFLLVLMQLRRLLFIWMLLHQIWNLSLWRRRKRRGRMVQKSVLRGSSRRLLCEHRI